MFSSTAHEALFQYIGLELHGKFIEVLTSQQVFKAILVMIFGTMFFVTTVQFFSRYLPGALVKRTSVPLSKYVRITACLFLGLSLLRVGSTTEVKRQNRKSWHDNQYITSKSPNVKPEYRVSFVFELVSHAAEEMTHLIHRVIDDMFKTGNSEIEAPSFFYKAILYAGASTVKDRELRSAVHMYSEECMDRVIPAIEGSPGLNRLDQTLRSDREIDQKLSGLMVTNANGQESDCLTLKSQMRGKLQTEAAASVDDLSTAKQLYLAFDALNDTTFINLKMSAALLDQYSGEHDGPMGIQKMSQPKAASARTLQYMNRFFSWDGLMSLFGSEELGAELAAERSQEFSENLIRAPLVVGFIKMALIAIFPWLVFPVVAGHWRILVWWAVAYTSILMWAPIWTLLYHVMTGISLSAETMAAFGKLSDGISLYSANLILSRMNYMYAVYSWIQLLVGTAFTGSILWFARPILSDSKEESSPEYIESAGKIAGVANRVL